MLMKLNFLACKTETIIVISQICCEDQIGDCILSALKTGKFKVKVRLRKG